MKIFVYSENLSLPFDEGIKKTAINIISSLSEIATVYGVCRYGDNLNKTFIHVIDSNRLLISFRLRKVIKDFSPDILLYIPMWSGTFASFLRMKILNIYNQKSKTVMVILQPKRLSKTQRKLIKLLKPNKVLTPSPKVINQMSDLHISAEFLPLSVDNHKFKPLENLNRKYILRKKYGIPLEKFIILHVGHINSGRNIEALIPLQKNNYQVLVVGSSSTSEVSSSDNTIKELLKRKGICIIDNYVENIEEIYQLSDVYVFPVDSEKGCIGIPLSILEAKACGLPIVTTDFGGLRLIFEENQKEFIYSSPEGFFHNINKIKENPGISISTDIIGYINNLYKTTLANILKD